MSLDEKKGLVKNRDTLKILGNKNSSTEEIKKQINTIENKNTLEPN